MERLGLGELIPNRGFEYAPTFTAATSTTDRWIDGTASGSTSDYKYKWWAFLANVSEMQFDNTVSHSGTNSIKITKVSGGTSSIYCQSMPDNNLNSVPINLQKAFGIPVLPSTSYTLSFWRKQTIADGASNFYYQQFSGVSATRITFTSAGSNNSTNLDWTKTTATFTTNSATAFLALAFGLETCSQGSLWIDDVSLITTTPPTRTAI